MKYTKEQYIEGMQGYYGPDEDVSNEETALVKVRKPHECMGLDADDSCHLDIEPGDMAICEKAIHVDFGRQSTYVCLPCADKWLAEIYPDEVDEYKMPEVAR